MKLHTRDSLIATAATLTLILTACSSKQSDDDTGGTGLGGASGSQGGSDSAAGGKVGATGGRAVVDTSVAVATGGSSALANLPQACSGFPVSDSTEDGGVCRGVGEELEASTLDMMIAVDRTMSMTYCPDGRHDTCGVINNNPAEPSRWDILQQGLDQFLTDIATNMPAVRQPRMGLQFFGNGSDESIDPRECNPATYAAPKVPMGDFATAAAAIRTDMDAMGKNLGGQTPWQPALQGVLQYAQEWQVSHPERVTVVLFVTDGFPTECNRDMTAIQTTVGEFYWGVQGDYNTVGKPGIRTFILGVGGDFDSTNRYNLDSVAFAGGTNQATIASDTAGVSDFTATLQNISNSKVDCDFSMPPAPTGSILDTSKVQVVYEPFVGDPQEIPSATSAGACGTANGGWYYDDPVTPTKVILCPCSCANLGAGRINVKFGCRPKPVVG
jgi:hypothetical protein